MKKKIFLTLIFISFIELNIYSQIYTPTNVYVVTLGGLTYPPDSIVSYRLFWENEIKTYNWRARILEFDTNSGLYNCHGYAWHVSDGGNKVLVEHPDPYINGALATYSLCNNQNTFAQDTLIKVYYDGALHSAITTRTPGYVISKWGGGPLVLHYVNDCPYALPPNQYTLKYYELIMPGDTIISKGAAKNVSTLNITGNGATYYWSSDGTFVCASGGNTNNASVTGLDTTQYGQKGKVGVTIHSYNSNTTVKGYKHYKVTAPPKPYISSQTTLVCASGVIFTLNNVPSGNTVTWSSSPSSHLHTNDTHANPCTFTSTGNGSDTVKATLSTPCSSNVIPVTKYPVWSGAPVFSSISGPYSTPNHHEASFYVVPDSKEAITSYTWNLNPLNGNSLYPSGSSLIIAFYNTGSYQLLVSAHNICGTGPIFWRGVNVYASNILMRSPNTA